MDTLAFYKTWTLLCVWIIGVKCESFITTECYGKVLSLSCKPGHRIKVLDDFFGLAAAGRTGPDSCQYLPGDCTVTNDRVTSVIHRYCEGKQSCTRFQVDRRNCGLNATTYQQIEYECVPDKDVTNVCETTSLQASEGYIATPGFPAVYPPNLHCQCRFRALSKDAEVELTFIHFVIKFDSPCKDWVELEVDGGVRRRLCGAYRSALRGSAIDLTFHSDENNGHQGLWVYYSTFPSGNDVGIAVECGPTEYAPSTSTSTSTSAPTSSPSPTTTHSHSNVDSKRKKSSKKTGVIIICICVGGILLLIIILSVLLCINKKRSPTRKSLKEKKEKLQERLNSLSFYDSIPLYDSIGRKGGVPRAPPGESRAMSTLSARDASTCLPSAGQCIPWKSEAPYWTTLQADFDSDQDSAVYAELDRASRAAASSSSTPSAAASPRTERDADTVTAYSFSLETQQHCAEEDISTHV